MTNGNCGILEPGRHEGLYHSTMKQTAVIPPDSSIPDDKEIDVDFEEGEILGTEFSLKVIHASLIAG